MPSSKRWHAIAGGCLWIVAGSLLAARAPAQDRLPVMVLTGANNHDWEWTAYQLEAMLEDTGRFEVDVVTEPANALAQPVERYAAIVLDYNGPRWGEPAESHFLAAVRDGVGVAVIHAANNAFPGWVEYEQLVGHCWRDGTGHGRFHPFDVQVIDRDHPITQGMDDLRAHPDELYHRLVHMHDVPFRLLAHALSTKESGGTGQHEPMIVVKEFGKGRVFHTPLGHVWKGVPDTQVSLRDPQLRQLIARGTEWAATGAVTLPAASPNTLSESERQAGWQMLFDGKTTAGWRGYQGRPTDGWIVDEGVLTRVKGGEDLVTEQEFGEFEFSFEWSMQPGGNSGVIYRCAETAPASWMTGPEYQLLDDAAHQPDAKHATAALYDLESVKDAKARAVGWNQGRIVVAGGRVEHWLNGVKVVDCSCTGAEWEQRIGASKFKEMAGFGRQAKGRIALQNHAGASGAEHEPAVAFRSLKIRALPVRAANDGGK